METFKTCKVVKLASGYAVRSKVENETFFMCEFAVIFTPRICLKMCELYATVYEHFRCDEKLSHVDACLEMKDFFDAHTSKEMRIPEAKPGFEFVIDAKAYYPKEKPNADEKVDS